MLLSRDKKSPPLSFNIVQLLLKTPECHEVENHVAYWKINKMYISPLPCVAGVEQSTYIYLLLLL